MQKRPIKFSLIVNLAVLLALPPLAYSQLQTPGAADQSNGRRVIGVAYSQLRPPRATDQGRGEHRQIRCRLTARIAARTTLRTAELAIRAAVGAGVITTQEARVRLVRLRECLRQWVATNPGCAERPDVPRIVGRAGI